MKSAFPAFSRLLAHSRAFTCQNFYLCLAMTFSDGDIIRLILVGTGNSVKELMFANSAGLLLSMRALRFCNSSMSSISRALVTKFWVLQDLGRVLYNLEPSLTLGSNSTTSLKEILNFKIFYLSLMFYCIHFDPFLTLGSNSTTSMK